MDHVRGHGLADIIRVTAKAKPLNAEDVLRLFKVVYHRNEGMREQEELVMTSLEAFIDMLQGNSGTNYIEECSRELFIYHHVGDCFYNSMLLSPRPVTRD